MNDFSFTVSDDWTSGFIGDVVVSDLSNSLNGWTMEFEIPFEIEEIWGAELVNRNGDRYRIKHVWWNETVASGQTFTFGFKAKGSSTGQFSDIELNNQPFGETPSADGSGNNSGGETDTDVPSSDVNGDSGSGTKDDSGNSGSDGSDSGGNSSDDSTDAGAADVAAMNYEVTDDWGGGFIGDVTVQNSGGVLKGWTMEFEVPFEIEEIWGAELVNRNGDRYRIKHVWWNETVASGQTFTFGFKAKGSSTGQFSDIELNNQPFGETPSTDGSGNSGGETDTDVPSSDVNGDSGSGTNDDSGNSDSGGSGSGGSDGGNSSGDSTDAGAADVAAMNYEVTDDWGGGFIGDVTVQNSGGVLKGWTMEFEVPFEIEEIWGAELVNRNGDRYTIKHVWWNETVASGQTFTFGFKAKGSSKGTFDAIKLNDQILENSPGSTDNHADSGTDDSGIDDSGTDNTGSDPGEMGSDTGNTGSDPGDTGSDTGDTGSDSGDAGSDTGNTGSDSGDTGSDPGDTGSDTGDTRSDTGDSGIGTDGNDGHVSSPQSGTFNYGEALQKSFLFYEAQRSGALPDDNRIEWRGDSALNDGQDVGLDLTGGYYDAGNDDKLGFSLASSMTMLSWGAIEYEDAYKKSGQLDEVLESIKWGTDWILKTHVTDSNGTKELWGHVDGTEGWYPFEDVPDTRVSQKVDRQNPGSDLAGESAAALAAASIAFRDVDPAYADTLLKNAIQLYDFADTYRGVYTDTIPDAAEFYHSAEYMDELVWGATWLYKATGDQSYLDKAESYYDTMGFGFGWTHDWSSKSQGAAVLLAQETGNPKYMNHSESWLNSWSDTSGGGISYTDGGLAFLGPWASLRYSANTAFIAGVYSDTVNDYDNRYSNFAESQIDYILGDNPRNSSYMVGFGENSPVRPHQPSAHGVAGWGSFNSSEPNQNILYGALVGGPASLNDFDYVDERSDYIRNEVALDYNAAFTGALARMYDTHGGDPLTDAQLNNLPGIVVSDS